MKSSTRKDEKPQTPRRKAAPRANSRKSGKPAGTVNSVGTPRRGKHRDSNLTAGAQKAEPPPAIGPKLKEYRLRENLTLHDLQSMTGISKSMLSQIERGVVNPTFARVWQLTQSLGIGVGELLGEISSSLDRVRTYEHLKVNTTPVMTSADGLCITRILSPIHQSLPVEWYEMCLKPGGFLRANAHGNGAWEHQTVISGQVIVEVGDDEFLLKAGETVRYSAEQPHGARNEGKEDARTLLVVISLEELAALGI